jgi:acyl-CoA thioesterase YciA
MAIGVEAWVSRLPSGERTRVAEAEFVFVAVDANGAPRPLPEQA